MQRSLTILIVALGMVAGSFILEIGSLKFDRPRVAAEGAAKEGRLTGMVTRGPTRPVARAGEPPASKPVPGIKLFVKTPKGREVKTAVSDKQGMYSISLPAGTYQVENERLGGMESTKDLPADVVITGGKETRLDVRIDTGIR